MNSFDGRNTFPEFSARELLFELKIDSFPINVQDVISKLGIVYREMDFGDTASDGVLMRKGGKAMIVINSAIAYSGRKNFTMAHELGHFKIKGHDSAEYRCSSRDLDSFQSEKVVEYEANQFATEFLMPEQNVRAMMKRRAFNRETIEKISNDFATSLTSAALRAVKLTDDPCAIVVSTNNKILWSQSSQNFRYEIKPKGQILSENTYATDFFLGKTVPDRPEAVNPLGWLSSTKIPNDLELREHSIYFPKINMVLSLLTFPEKDDYEIDDDEE